GQHRTPIRGLGIFVRPDPLAGVHVPGLNLTDVVGTRGEYQVARDARVAPAGDVLHSLSDHRGAQVLVGGDVDQSCLGTEGNRRPVLAAPPRRAKIRHLPGTRLAVRIDIGPPRLVI